MLHADLAPLVLELARWGVQDARRLCWMDPLPAGHMAQARVLLQRLGALDARGAVTAHGRVIARLGMHPRLAHMLLCSHELGYARLGCELAVLLSETDPLRGGDCDMQLRVEWLRGADIGRVSGGARRASLRALVSRSYRQLGVTSADRDDAGDLGLCGVLLAFAYPDRIAQRRSGGDNRFLLSNGRGARFAQAEPLAAESLIVAAHLKGEREACIYLAAALDIGQLLEFHADLISEQTLVAWDSREQAVQARSRQCLGKLILDDRPLLHPDHSAVQHAMLEGIRQCGLDCLPWNDDLRQLQARVNFLHRLEAGQWPDLSAQALLDRLDDWLFAFLPGVTRLAQLKRLDLRAALLVQLDREQQQRLDRQAPSQLPVPSGSRIRLDYTGPVPVLAVRLQEMFGLAETPCVAAGRVPVLLQLLSPAQRPVQVTQDLAGFWHSSYRAVKKELQGRYPRHYWPDNPLQAQATARAKPRK